MNSSNTDLTRLLGPLAEILNDSRVSDVLVVGTIVWTDRGNGLQREEIDVGSEDEMRALAVRIAALCGRRLDDAQPWVDARLPDGTRVHAVLPIISHTGVCISLRLVGGERLTVADLLAAGTLTETSAELLQRIVEAKLTYLVSGATGSGKTTLLNALLGLVPRGERLLIVEEMTELAPHHPHVISLHTRPANAEGAGAVELRDLLRQALRMRPDRLVLGECRGAEIVDFLAALNTGHEGSCGSIHANTAAEVISRCEALAAYASLERDAVHTQLAASVQCVLHMSRRDGVRKLHHIGVVQRSSIGEARIIPAWSWERAADVGMEHLITLLEERQ